MNGELVKTITGQLKALGIAKGESIMVHSSLRALGSHPDKARAVIAATLQVIGEEGTLLMPALTYETTMRKIPVFNVEKTPSCAGALSEYFRTQPYVQRSLHPTHSVCATGKKSNFFLEHHYFDRTPVGKNSPFKRLNETGGKIVFLGCSLNANTSMHGVEELSAPEYLFGEELEYTIELRNGNSLRKKYITHNFKGFEQRYDRVLGILSKDDYALGKVLDADTYVLKSRPMWEKAHKKLCEDPLYFVNKISDSERGLPEHS